MASILHLLLPRQQTSALPAANTNTEQQGSNTQATGSQTQLTGQTFMTHIDTYVAPVVIIWAIVFCVAWIVAIAWAYSYNRGYHWQLPKRFRGGAKASRREKDVESGGAAGYHDANTHWDHGNERGPTLPPYSAGQGNTAGHNESMVGGGRQPLSNNNLRPPPR